MSITIKLNQEELQGVITDFVKTNYGIPLDGKTVQVNFTAGRKGSGTSVEIEILNANEVLANASVAEASNLRQQVISNTGTDALGHAATKDHATDVGTAASVPEVTSEPVLSVDTTEPAGEVDDGTVDLPPVTPETPVPSAESKSIFD